MQVWMPLGMGDARFRAGSLCWETAVLDCRFAEAIELVGVSSRLSGQ
jgi:hypothetical protein